MTTNENNFKDKCKSMRELFFGKKKVKTHFNIDNVLNYTNEHTNGRKSYYRSFDKEDNLEEYCVFNIELPKKSTDLSECDKFYELFYSETKLNNDSNNKESIDKDGVKYTSNLYRNKYNTSCGFEMTYTKKIQSKYF
jgi:hypothetical protein